MTAREQIEIIPQSIAERIKAKRIILFGSHAYGCPDKDSDIDLCVILALGGRHKIEVMHEIRKTLAGDISLAMDILVYDTKDFDERAVSSILWNTK